MEWERQLDRLVIVIAALHTGRVLLQYTATTSQNLGSIWVLHMACSLTLPGLTVLSILSCYVERTLVMFENPLSFPTDMLVFICWKTLIGSFNMLNNNSLLIVPAWLFCKCIKLCHLLSWDLLKLVFLSFLFISLVCIISVFYPFFCFLGYI